MSTLLFAGRIVSYACPSEDFFNLIGKLLNSELYLVLRKDLDGRAVVSAPSDGRWNLQALHTVECREDDSLNLIRQALEFELSLQMGKSVVGRLPLGALSRTC
ncbi:hypothetical protein QQ045_004974 [Rhodiola kirilowii]